jgi:hypothetical protein
VVGNIQPTSRSLKKKVRTLEFSFFLKLLTSTYHAKLKKNILIPLFKANKNICKKLLFIEIYVSNKYIFIEFQF